ncbi:hypothetical protein D3C73_1249930 [compost metagenome]
MQRAVISEESARHIRLEYGDIRTIATGSPEIIFNGNLTVDLGGVTCELRHVGGDHAADSCILYVPEDKVLFLGDALGPSVYGGPRKYTSGSFLRLLEIAYSYDTEWIVESHSVPLNSRDFRADLAPWERLARLVDVFGPHRDRVLQELKDYLKLDELPEDLLHGLEYFMAGFK